MSLAENSPPEGDNAAAAVGDRKDHPAMEPVEGLAAALRHGQQPGLLRQGQRYLRRFQRLLQGAARIGRIAQAEPRDGFVVEAAPLEIIERRFAARTMQFLLEEGAGGFDRVEQRGLPLGLLAFLRRRLRHLEPGFAGQPLDRLGEGQMLGAHDEADHVAMRPAAEAMEKALLFVDGEAGRFLVMERAQSGILAALAHQAHAPADHPGERHPGADFIEECGRKGHGQGATVQVPARSRRLPFGDGAGSIFANCPGYPQVGARLWVSRD